jgi:hypothetical protein
MEADIDTVDRGERVSIMEPLLIGEGSRHWGALTDLALDLTQKSAGFRRNRLLPHAQLAVLPGTDHMAMTTRTSSLAPMIAGSLDAARPNLK